jgi:hypothetical protein
MPAKIGGLRLTKPTLRNPKDQSTKEPRGSLAVTVAGTSASVDSILGRGAAGICSTVAH